MALDAFRLIFLSALTGCHRPAKDPRTVVMIIESSPNNLDLRQGTDAQSERVGGVIFDALVKKDEHYNLQPWLATSWEQPDPLTLVIHLRDGVRFHDGRPLEAEDVAWTIRSMIDGTLITAKGGRFASVDRVEVRDRLTLVLHLKHPDAGLLFNMSDGLFGVVPRGSGPRLRPASDRLGTVSVCERGAGQRGHRRAQSGLLGGRSEDRWRSVHGGSGCDYQRARAAEGIGRSCEQCADASI